VVVKTATILLQLELDCTVYIGESLRGRKEVRTWTLIQFNIIWLYSPSRALASPSWGFLTITFLRGWIVTPAPNPQPGGQGLRIYDPRRQSGSAIPPGTVL
jgi:hypothetical protein